MSLIANQLQPRHQRPLFQQHLQAYQDKLQQQLKLQQSPLQVLFCSDKKHCFLTLHYFAGSGSGGLSNAEFCAMDQEHTMCKYPVSLISKTGLRFEIYLIRAPQMSAPPRLSSGS